MADYNNQQHLAYLRQDQAASRHHLRQVSEEQAPQEALTQAALEAHLRQHQQEAVSVIQGLEQDRLRHRK